MDLATFNKEAQLLFVSPFVLFFLISSKFHCCQESERYFLFRVLTSMHVDEKAVMTQGNKIIR